jgi:hypothetical protein
MKKINSLIPMIVLLVMLILPQGSVFATSEIEAPQQSLSKLVWESKSDMPTARYSMGAAVSGGKIYVIGGDNYSCTPLTNVEEYDPATETWSTRASMPTGRWGVGVATGPDGQIYAFGGMGGGYCGADMLTTVEAYDPATDSWATRASMPSQRSGFGMAAASNGRIYIMGGVDSNGLLATVEEYNPATDSWTQKADMPWPNNNIALAAASNGKIYVLGGDVTTEVLLEYDPEQDSWMQRASIPVARYGVKIVQASDGRIYAVGGGIGGGYTTSVEAYDPVSDIWLADSSINIARSGHILVAVGDQIFAMGGWGPTGGTDGGPLSSVEAGTITLIPAPENDNFASATIIDTLPFIDMLDNSSATTEEGENQYCYYSPRTVWYKFTAAIDSEIRISTEGSSFSDITLTAYRDTGAGLGGLQHINCTSYTGSMAFAVQAGATYYIQAGSISSYGELHINVQEVAPPPNDDFASATVISTLPFDETMDAAGAGTETGEPVPSCAGNGGPYKSVWYAYTPANDGVLSASVPSAIFVPILSVYTGSNLTGLAELGCQVFTGNVINIPASAGMTYYFQISKNISGDMDGSVQFHLEEKHPPANDNFANATPADTLPFSAVADITDATTEPYEPQACYTAYKTVWYSITPSANMLVQADMFGSSFYDTILNVYQANGPGMENLSFMQCAYFGSALKFNAQAGRTYYIQAGSIYGSGGSLQLNLQEIQRPSNDDFVNAKIVESLPYSDTVDISNAATEPNELQNCYYAYQTVWYTFTPTTNMLMQVDMSGSSFYDTIINVYQANGSGMGNLGFMQCAAFGNSLKFNAQAGVTYYIQAGSIYGSGGSLHLNLQELVRPVNDDFANAKAIEALAYSDTVDVSNATLEPGEQTGCYSSSQTVWYSFTPSANMLIQVDTSGSSFYDSFFNFYQSYGPDIRDLNHMYCSAYGNPLMFMVQAGETYYIQAGSMYGSSGTLQLNVQELPRPANDDFANATVITTLPFEETPNTRFATREANEPMPSCNYSGSGEHSVWYAYTPTASGSISASIPWATVAPVVAAYTGSSLSGLTEIGCQSNSSSLLTFKANAGATYYFQISNFYSWEGGGEIDFRLEGAPPPVAEFSYYPGSPSTFDMIEFYNLSSDPGNAGFQSFTWKFGDGSTSTDYSPLHKYAKDGDYTVQLSVATLDDRTASASHVVHVKTSDVAITKLAVPQSASAGQTRTITVSVSSKAYSETVQIDLYRSTAGGFELIGTLTQVIPARSSNKTVAYNFNYTFTNSDASIGKVTFYAVATIVNGRDSYPADNESYSIPIKVNKRK